ncbi:MAG: DUF1616 domain-containing protein [Candidatus Bathyarchaeota archaeon]|nr:DUF1616 domain-containing protein [Candidatus Bathyarchaeota archaeon]
MNPIKWLSAIISYIAVTLLCVYLIPADSTLSAFTSFFGFTFVAFVPGYCLVNLLFHDGKLDLPETAVLSVALSFSIAGISGLFLGISPLGLTVNSITLTLSSIVAATAAFAFLRKTGMLHLRKHAPLI